MTPPLLLLCWCLFRVQRLVTAATPAADVEHSGVKLKKVTRCVSIFLWLICHLDGELRGRRPRVDAVTLRRRWCCCCFVLCYFPPAVQSPRRNWEDEKRGGAVGDRRGRGCQQTWISAGDDGVTHTAAQQLDAHRGAYWRWQSFQRGSYLWNEAFSWRFEDERRLVICHVLPVFAFVWLKKQRCWRNKAAEEIGKIGKYCRNFFLSLLKLRLSEKF